MLNQIVHKVFFGKIDDFKCLKKIEIPIMNNFPFLAILGALFSVLSGAEGICSLFGSLVFNPIYSATLGFFEGFVFLVMALFIFLGLCHIRYVNDYDIQF